MNNKETGSFYTPYDLVEYMITKISKKISISILEPSFGDGRFIDKLLENDYKNITGIELFSEKIKNYKNKKDIELIHSDFIKFALKSKQQYDLIIGNPPYIAKKQLKQTDRDLNTKVLEYFNLPNNIFQNVWVSFVLGSLKLLKKNGTIFFVLPFEFLQVQYAEKLRNYLETQFNYIEITTFEEKVFEEIEQDICLVFLTNKSKIHPLINYKTYNNINDMKLVSDSKISRHKPLKKWSNSIINDEETSFLKELSTKYLKISELGAISPGIVTGANDYFIINKSTATNLLNRKTSLPIISKGVLMPNLLIFNKNDLSKLENTQKPTQLINLNNTNEKDFSKDLKLYLSNDFDKYNMKIRERYKCRIRNRWFDVPIIKNGDLMFFKRYNIYPKLVQNEANIYTTDIAYNIRLKDIYDAKSVAFCFYNSLTLALCEYNGRFYGGGVNELVPSEFKSLYIPYKKIKQKDIVYLDKMFRKGLDIEDIINYVDKIVFENIDIQQLNNLKEIRKKYYKRRLKNNNLTLH